MGKTRTETTVTSDGSIIPMVFELRFHRSTRAISPTA